MGKPWAEEGSAEGCRLGVDDKDWRWRRKRLAQGIYEANWLWRSSEAVLSGQGSEEEGHWEAFKIDDETHSCWMGAGAAG